jgi:uncharacterized protein YbcI
MPSTMTAHLPAAATWPPLPLPMAAPCRQLARAVSSFEHALLGRSPTSVTVIAAGASMVVHVHEPFSELERSLAHAGEAGAERVREFHRDLFHRTADALLEHIQTATGVRLRGAIAHVDTLTGSVLKTFATGPEIDLFVMGHGLPALGVPVNDHRQARGTIETSGSRRP